MWELQLVLSIFGFLCLMFLSVLVIILYEKVKTYEQFIFKVFSFVRLSKIFFEKELKKSRRLFKRQNKDSEKLLSKAMDIVSYRSIIDTLDKIKEIYLSEKPVMSIINCLLNKKDKNSCEFKDIKKGEKENEKVE